MPNTYSNSDSNTLADQLQEYLLDIDYPANKRDLLHAAEEQGANDELLALLEQLPEKQYNSWEDVNVAMDDYNIA
jgi:hypothetical protein